MGHTISHYVRYEGKNPLVDAISRNKTGELVIDVNRVIKALAPGDLEYERQGITDLTKALGTQARLNDLRKYSKTYHRIDDYGYGYDIEWSPLGGKYTDQALKSALEAFGIKEKGQQEAARIAQAGRDKARQANFGAELESINRRALAASEDNARNQESGASDAPDVVLSTDTDAEDASDGRDARARRRRAAFSGGGLRI